MRGRRLLVAALACAVAVVGPLAAPATAHPLGNFTTNTFAGLYLSEDGIEVDYVVDLAEIPTLRARGDIDADGDDKITEAEARVWAAGQCARLIPLLRVRLDGTPRTLEPGPSAATFADGEAGLQTVRLECGSSAGADLRDVERVDFRDATFADRIGWREIVAEASGITITHSDVPATSPSGELRAYPRDGIAAPMDQRTASVRLSAGTPAGRLAGSAGISDGVVAEVDRATTSFTGLISRRQLSLGFVLLALLAAGGLGALHALAPGHGKTVMAAYLVGEHGSGRQALGLGLTVAVTHTVGVLLLGVALSTTQAVAPERLYPWLGAASGVLFTAVGVLLLRRSIRAAPHEHRPAPATAALVRDHGHPTATADHPNDAVTWRTLALPGLAGGLLPSPSAVLVLLGGVALGRAWFGVTLVVAYGTGMAATLVGAGYLVLRVRERIELSSRVATWRPFRWVAQRLPVAAALLVVVGGLVITTRGLLAA